MKRVFNIIAVLTAIAFLTECKVNEGDIKGGLPYLNLSISDTTLSKTSSVVEIPIETNRKLDFLIFSEDGAWLSVDQVDNSLLRLTVQENKLERDREASIAVFTTNSILTDTLYVTQDPSGELTFKGDLVLKSKGEIMANTYTKVTGSLIVRGGKSTSNQPAPSATSDIDNEALDTLSSQINEIQSGVLVIEHTQATQFPINLIKENNVKEVLFISNQMSNLPSQEQMAELGLTLLNISGNAVSDISSLEGCETITSLDISNTNITDLSSLASLPDLSYLEINGLAVTDAQVEILQEVIPECEIVAKDTRPEESPLPEVEITGIEETSETSFKITATLVNKNDELPSKVGFYIGNKKRLKEMSFVEAAYSASDNTFSYEYSGANLSNAIYYFRAAATNSKGEAYSTIRYIGKKINNGDVFISNEEDLQAFYDDNISHIEGSLFIGRVEDNWSSGAIELSLGDSTLYFTKSAISSLSLLSNIVSIKGGVYIVNTDVASINSLVGIRDLETIWAKGNKINTIPDFTQLHTLKALNVSRNNISDFTPLYGTTIESLYLGDVDDANNETNRIGVLSDLNRLSTLKYLDLSGLPLHSWQVDELRGQMAGCNIVFTPGSQTPFMPDVTTLGYSPSEGKVILKGRATCNTVYPITEYGFYYGKNADNLTKIKVGTEVSDGVVEYQCEVSIPDGDEYIYQAYVVSQFGELKSHETRTFTLSTVDLSANGTANCYIVSIPWKHRFKCTVKGNSDEPVGDIASVEVIWETKNTDESVTKGEIIKSVTLVDDYIELYPSDNMTPGNALVAVKDADGNILWSWHIWVVDYDPESTRQLYRSGAIMMDRNLGALDLDPDGVKVFGLLYQWGRKDPFVGCGNVNNASFAVTYPKEVISHKDFSTGLNWLEYSIKCPTVVMDNCIWNRDDSLWMSNKTKYDPCPPGWKVPEGGPGVWEGFVHPNKQFSMGVVYDALYSVPSAYYPQGGYTDGNSTILFPGYASYNWSCTPYYNDAYDFHFFNGYGRPEDRRSRDSQFSVRCSRDEEMYIKTYEVENLSDTQATLKGELSVVKANVRYKGFVVSKGTSTLTVESAPIKLVSGNSDGVYESELTGLEYNVTYYYRAFVNGESGTRYGETLSFTTKKAGNGDGYTEDEYEW